MLITIVILSVLFAAAVALYLRASYVNRRTTERLFHTRRHHNEALAILREQKAAVRQLIQLHQRNEQQLETRAHRAELQLQVVDQLLVHVQAQLTEAEHAYDVMHTDYETTARALEESQASPTLLSQCATSMAIEYGVVEPELVENPMVTGEVANRYDMQLPSVLKAEGKTLDTEL